MCSIVFIGTYSTGSSRDALAAAQKLGYYTILFTDRKNIIDNKEEFPDVDQMEYVDLSNMDEMLARIQSLMDGGKQIKGIVSFIDSHVHKAAQLSRDFCNPNISVDAIYKMENKILTRRSLANTPYNIRYSIIKHHRNASSFIKKHKFPLIIKSPDSTASKDVFLATTPSHFFSNIKKLNEKYPKKQILLEEYIEGPQYLVETLVYNKQVYIVAIIEQEIPEWEKFIITGYSLLPEIPHDQFESISKAVQSIIQSLGMEFGACHLEMRLVNNEWKLIEINPRISGSAMNKMIEAAFGINLVQETLKLFLGMEPALEKKHNHFVYTQHVTVSAKGILKQITDDKLAAELPGVKEVFIKSKIGDVLSPPFSMGNRYAYVIASGNSKEEARKSAKEAAEKIKFFVQPYKKRKRYHSLVSH